MLEDVAVYLVLAPLAAALLGIAGCARWALRRRPPAAVAVEKESAVSD